MNKHPDIALNMHKDTGMTSSRDRAERHQVLGESALPFPSCVARAIEAEHQLPYFPWFSLVVFSRQLDEHVPALARIEISA